MRTALITFPLILKVRSQNPSATLLLLFINDDANDNNSNTRFDMEMVLKRERMVKKYLSEMKLPLLDAALSRAEPGSIVDLADPEVVLLRDAIDTIGTWDDFKSRFKQLLEPAMGSERPALKKMLGSTLPGGTMRFKDYHTIVPPWPHLASKQMTREGLEAIMAGARCGSARYVEIGWKA